MAKESYGDREERWLWEGGRKKRSGGDSNGDHHHYHHRHHHHHHQPCPGNVDRPINIAGIEIRDKSDSEVQLVIGR
ncbi:hypothetical protein E2C01_052088 [Portunus trituberculatus]|uniref:Uncharacterized protein n=1 Tax=Portunus trituberculatus TaxID=210409 RepID=A0A5B7GKQ6_PORTR|nr:hypothetical protein [Portunus trituberculatus]